MAANTALSALVAQFEGDIGVAHQLVHGPAIGEGSIVQTEGGPVRTMARLLSELEAQHVAVIGSGVWLKLHAANLDALITGAITRDSNGAATSAAVVWPDGKPGTYTATSVSAAHPGAVDAYTVTYGSPVTSTVTQPAVTRDATGAVTNRPAMTVS